MAASAITTKASCRRNQNSEAMARGSATPKLWRSSSGKAASPPRKGTTLIIALCTSTMRRQVPKRPPAWARNSSKTRRARSR